MEIQSGISLDQTGFPAVRTVTKHTESDLCQSQHDIRSQSLWDVRVHTIAWMCSCDFGGDTTPLTVQLHLLK